jgi:Tfp pilus assembly protein FimT
MNRFLVGSTRQAGFSITEALTYLAIVAILGLTAMPVFSDIQQEYNLRGAVRRVYGEMQKARMAAVAHNVRFRVQVSSDALVTLQEYDVDTGAWEDFSADSAASNDTPGIYVTGTAQVVFSPNGTVVQPALLTVLNSVGMQKRIVVNRSGSIEIL